MKAVVTLSSLAGQMGPSSDSARALDKPAEAFDRMQLAYKVSKAALNQGALLALYRCRYENLLVNPET